MSVWHREIWIVTLSFFAVLTIGLVIGQWQSLFLGLSLIFLARQLYQIYRFERWIRLGGKSAYPDTKGVWEEIYYHVYRIRKNDKRRKKKLGKMIDQFRLSTEALPDAAVVLGKDDEIEWANSAALNVLGLQQSDKGQRILNLLRHPDFVRYFEAREYTDAIILPSPVDTKIQLAIRIVAYGVGLRLLLAQDVTQLKQMERMRKDFVANVSHELRTPLTVLVGYLETLQELDRGDSPIISTSLEKMRGQTERMQHLVNDLLMLTRLETQQRRANCVDIAGLLHRICNEDKGIEKSSGRVELEIDTAAKIFGDEQELQSAFGNLVGNALKYSPSDTKISVRWFLDGAAPVLEVKDCGIGIAAADIPRVTERFYRADSHHGRKIAGTGLGLAIVKHVLIRHDAHLNIMSELGKGSCFSCHFPAQRICD